jgi:DNA helicase HerA-like ATPase
MSLFTWIKRYPNLQDRPLRGLLIIDEAKDFVPSVKSSPSKASIQLLAAQARKYHLGLLLATQNPKDIENKVIANCATQFYGRASAPNSQQVIREQLQSRGGRGDDIGTLKSGQFYAYNSEANMSQPVKIIVPMCLSRHKTLEESEILHLAAKSRKQLA